MSGLRAKEKRMQRLDQPGKGHTRRRGQSKSLDPWVDWFEREYARIEREEGLEAAKAFFREHFASPALPVATR